MFGLKDYFLGGKEKDLLIGDEKFKRKIISQEGDETWVCFLPWRTTFEEATKYFWIPKKGSVIIYEGPSSLVGISPEQAKDSLEKVTKNAHSCLKKENFSNTINILGFSIGNFPAFYLANNLEIQKLIAVCPGARLGENIYKGILTKGVKQIAEKNYPTHESYDSIMNGMNPIDNIKNLPKNNIYIEISKWDKAILTSSGEELIKAIEKIGKRPIIKKNNFFGHAMTLWNWGHKNKTGKLDYLK